MAWDGLLQHRAWKFGSGREMAVIIATSPMLPNFVTHGKPHSLDALALRPDLALELGVEHPWFRRF